MGIYKPLQPNQIRLLTLLPAPTDARIKCFLKSIFLDETNISSYSAFSYRWGEETSEIWVNDESFSATSNLVVALKHFRDTTQSVTLWVDAICINMQDKKENKMQIKLMRSIYSNANETWVWLGIEADESNAAIDLIEFLSKGPPDSWKLEDETRLLPLEDLLCRDYWYRVWIVQEIAVSKNIRLFCGVREFSWDSVRNAVRFLDAQVQVREIIHKHRLAQKRIRSNEKVAQRGIQRIISIQSVRNDCLKQIRDLSAEPSDSLLFLLSNHRLTEASEAQDKYIALAGLVDAGLDTFEKLDTKCVRDVYMHSVQQISKSENTGKLISLPLDFLDCAGQPTNGNDFPTLKSQKRQIALPSFVPDWSYNQPQASPLLYWQLQKTKKSVVEFDASGRDGDSFPVTSEETFSINSIQGRLSARGILFDTITGLGFDEIASGRVHNPDSTYEQPYSISQYPTRESLAHVIWKTHFMNRNHLGQTLPFNWGEIFWRLGPSQKWFRQNKELKICGFSLEEIRLKTMLKPYTAESELPDKDVFQSFWNALMVSIEHRRLASTRKGYLCMAPWDCQLGDAVAILYDCRAPVVLRPYTDGINKYYQFLGTTYVHGIMHGEAVNSLPPEGRVAENFEIR